MGPSQWHMEPGSPHTDAIGCVKSTTRRMSGSWPSQHAVTACRAVASQVRMSPCQVAGSPQRGSSRRGANRQDQFADSGWWSWNSGLRGSVIAHRPRRAR